MATTLNSYTWGSSPRIPVTVSYDYEREGADMWYKVYVSVGAISGSSSFGYNIVANFTFEDGQSVSKTVKNNSPSKWSSPLNEDSGWIRVRNKTSGQTNVNVRLTTNSTGRSSIEYNYGLDVSPGTSDASFPSSITLGEPFSYTVTAYNSSFKNSVWLKIGSYDWVNLSGYFYGGGTKTVTAAIDTFAPQITGGTSASGILQIYTEDGSTAIGGKNYSVTVNVPSSVVPSITSYSLSMVNENEWLAGKTSYVQGYSKVGITAAGAGVYGSTIQSITTTVDGKSYSGGDVTSDVLASSGTLSVVCTVKDSRGRTATQTKNISVLPYLPPAITDLQYARGTYSGGSWTANDNGADVKVSFTAGLSLTDIGNTANIEVSVGYSDTQSKNGTTGAQVFYLTGFGIDDTKDVNITVTDLVGNTTQKTVTVPTVAVPMNLNMNLPGIGIGKVAEHENTLDIAWDVMIGGKSLLDWTHPVGSKYESVDPTDPHDLFGGTWERIKDRFTLAAGDKYAAGSTGGSADAVVVSHGHRALSEGSGSYGWGYSFGSPGVLSNSTATTSSGIEPTGESGTGKNMPPYYAMYTWIRTA